jgi:uncharacterized phage protein (TIGR01671 family)
MKKEFRVWSKSSMRYVISVHDSRLRDVYFGISLDGDIYAIDNFGDEVSGLDEDLVIQQWTGLYDKNKKKIFEGDILEYTYTEAKGKAPVVFSHKFAAYVLDTSRRHLIDDKYGDFFFLYAACNPLVIGNIMENPELLKA